MSAYLDEHLPHLTALHNSLGLPHTALEEDRIKIDAAIKAVVVSIVRERETEVENWKEKIELARKDVVCLGKALGNRVVGTVDESDEALPRRHEKLLIQRRELEQGYRERLHKVEELQEALVALANLLGAPFEHPKPLQPVAGPSHGVNQAQARLSLASTACTSTTTGGSRKISGTGASFKPETAQERKRSNVGATATVLDDKKHEVWLDVSDPVVEALELDCRRMTEERDVRRTELIGSIVELRWLHNELGFPALALNGSQAHFPQDMLPDKANEETPGAHQTYERLLAKFIFINKDVVAEENQEPELEGLDDVQPEIGLINWVNEIAGLWHARRDVHQLRIQEIFNQIEPQWVRMGVDQEFMDVFFAINMGSSESAIAAYEAELERVLELRRASLSTFMLAVRKEIEQLWTELMMSDEEKDEFIGFIDDNYTEELLQAHEEYSELLRAEIESKATIIPKVREWHALVEEEEELERTAADPNRFKMRGGALLREEKLRKRVQVLKPRIETELLKLLPQWENEAKRPFLIRGERVVDVIQDAIEAKEAAKEAKKRARQGLGPTKTVKATPAPATARAPATGTARKRLAPEATPLPAGLKRQKVVPASRLKPMTATKPRLPQSTSSTLQSSGYRNGRDAGSPTPTHLVPCGLPRPPANTNTNGGRAVSATTGSIYMSKIPMQTRVPSAPAPAPLRAATHAALGKDASRRPMRESFKPRSSIMPSMIGMDMGAAVVLETEGERWDLGEVDEGMEGEDVEVF